MRPEAARLGVLHDLEVAYIEKQPGPRPASSVHARRDPARASHRCGPGAAGVLAGPHRGNDDHATDAARHAVHDTQYTMTSPERFRRALAVTRLTRVAVTRWELQAGFCGVAMPVFGPGGQVVAAIELAVGDLGHQLRPVMAALAIASRSLSRELAGDARDAQATREPAMLAVIS